MNPSDERNSLLPERLQRAVTRGPVLLMRTIAGQRRAFQIFLSHSTQDREFCASLKSNAAEIGVEVYLAEHDHLPGGVLAEKIEAVIDDSNAVVVLLTSNSVSAPYVNQEIGYARKAGKLIIPLVQPGIESAKLAMLQGLEYIPFDLNDPKSGFERLNAALRRLINQQAAKQRQREIMAMTGLAAIGLVMAIADEVVTASPPAATAGQ